MPELPAMPEGTLTFMFTDIEGGTEMWERYPDAMRAALARHDSLMRAAVTGNGGMVFKTVGDGFCTVFAAVPDALCAALAAQFALRAATWELPTPPRVRMALHTGEVEHRDNDYFGPPLNRVARLLSAAHGGQILLTLAAEEMAHDALPPNVTLRDMGAHRLRDLARAEQIFQLLHPDLPDDFPPLKSLDSSQHPHNIPPQMTSFIGREKELAAIQSLLQRTRLLTLTGTGGCGKTRLALHLAMDVLEEYPHGVWLVELAALTDPALVPQAAAALLQTHEQPGKSLTQCLVETLRDRKLLLVLDNCEHLLTACGQLADALLRACPGVKILATSREALGIAGEQAYRVPSLALPERANAVTLEQLGRYEGTRLFIERAALYNPAWAATEHNSVSLAAVCERLDGIPLAIELAAGRIGSLTIEQIESRLDDRFHLLTGGNRAALPRHKTLRALIDWSYDLLTPSEKLLLNRLSVFAGGWTLDAAEQVCAGEGTDGEPLDEWDIMDVLTSLFDKSLVLAETFEETTRYHLLETVRQYAGENLTTSGESALLRQRHCQHFANMAEQAQSELQGPQQQIWLDSLQLEHDNFRAALAWCLETPGEGESEAGNSETDNQGSARITMGLKMANALHRFWDVRGHWSEGRRHLEMLMARDTAPEPTAVRAQALSITGWLAFRQGDYATTHRDGEQALAMNRTLGSRVWEAYSLNALGLAAQEQGDLQTALQCHEQAFAINRAIGNRIGEAFNLNNLGTVLHEQGDLNTARSHFEQALVISRATGNRTGETFSLNNLGMILQEQDDVEGAQTCHTQALAVSRTVGNQGGEASSLAALGRIALRQNDLAQARVLQTQALTIRRELGSVRQIAESLEAFAHIGTREGRGEPAARLLGAAETLRESIGASLPRSLHADYVQAAVLLNLTLGEDAFANAKAEGRSLSWEQALG